MVPPHGLHTYTYTDGFRFAVSSCRGLRLDAWEMNLRDVVI